MKRLSSYQKLKEELEQAKSDLRTVVMHPDSVAGMVIKTQVKMNDSFTNMVWYGETGKGYDVFCGFTNTITSAGE